MSNHACTDLESHFSNEVQSSISIAFKILQIILKLESIDKVMIPY